MTHNILSRYVIIYQITDIAHILDICRAYEKFAIQSGCSRAVDEYLASIGSNNIHLNKVIEKNNKFEAV